MAVNENGTYWLSDETWEQIEQLLPPDPPERKSGRRRIDNRKAMGAILRELRTWGRWDESKAESLVRERFQEWCRTGVFDRLWQVGILTYDELRALVLQGK
jgi:putative transposase